MEKADTPQVERVQALHLQNEVAEVSAKKPKLLIVQMPRPQGNFPNPIVIDQFKKEFDILYDQFWTNVLLYHLDVQVYNHSNFGKGVLDITFIYHNMNDKEVILESKGVIDLRYRRALKLLNQAFAYLVEMATESDSSPFDYCTMLLTPFRI